LFLVIFNLYITIKFIYLSHSTQTKMEYGKLLKAARKQLPEAILKKSRFEVPKVKGHIQGNRTVISNFNQIADFLRKDVNHLVKYVLKELAAPGNLTKTALIIGLKSKKKKIFYS